MESVLCNRGSSEQVETINTKGVESMNSKPQSSPVRNRNNNRMEVQTMKTTNIVTAIAATCLFCLTVLTAPANAALLQVDMQQSGATTQSGWTAWESAVNGFTGGSISSSFAYNSTTGGTLDVSMVAAALYAKNQGLDNLASGEADNLTYPDLWADQIYNSVNTWNPDVWLYLYNLKAGDYSFTSYHYADDLASNRNGTASVFVNGTDTGSDQEMLGGANQWTANQLETTGVFTTDFTVVNDGDTVVIYYDVSEAYKDFGFSGFELYAIPEPASFVLLLLGGFGLMFHRPRR